LIDQRRFAVIDVGDNSQIANIGALHAEGTLLVTEIAEFVAGSEKKVIIEDNRENRLEQIDAARLER
jgi:hypothetical protein